MSETAVELFTPYSTARPLMGGLPTWMNQYDQWRVTSYQIYEQIYWNVPDTFKLVARGAENQPIYIPMARTIVDTTSRYVGAGFGWAVEEEFGSDVEKALARSAFGTLFAREAFRSRFASNKKYGLIRGDWAWHVVADENKPEGRRISIYPLDPSSLFKVHHPEDVDRITAVHIIEQIADPDDESKVIIKRQTYSKGPDWTKPDEDDGRIYTYLATFDVEEWEDPASDPVSVIIPQGTALPDPITALPVYHIRNAEEPGNPWGSSELRGFERIMAAINQAVSDEELALALEGLGMYATNSGPPQENGRDVNWRLGPGRVVELNGDSKNDVFFERVTGVGSVEPVQDHLKFLINSLRDATALSDAATGKVDVTVAESGIALALQLAPMLAKADERDTSIFDTHVQMFWDLRAWFDAYEGVNLGGAVVMPRLGSKLPENRANKIKEIMEIVSGGLASPEWGRSELAKLGYVFPDDEGNNVVQAQQASALATDPYAARAAIEMDEPGNGGDDNVA